MRPAGLYDADDSRRSRGNEHGAQNQQHDLGAFAHGVTSLD